MVATTPSLKKGGTTNALMRALETPYQAMCATGDVRSCGGDKQGISS